MNTPSLEEIFTDFEEYSIRVQSDKEAGIPPLVFVDYIDLMSPPHMHRITEYNTVVLYDQLASMTKTGRCPLCAVGIPLRKVRRIKDMDTHRVLQLDFSRTESRIMEMFDIRPEDPYGTTKIRKKSYSGFISSKVHNKKKKR